MYQVQEVIEGLAKNVESSEPGTLQYQYFWHEKEGQFVFIETYVPMLYPWSLDLHEVQSHISLCTSWWNVALCLGLMLWCDASD